MSSKAAIAAESDSSLLRALRQRLVDRRDPVDRGRDGAAEGTNECQNCKNLASAKLDMGLSFFAGFPMSFLVLFEG